ncbi:hypothetical protein EJ07DRAFT_151599 [Lizonia empirigonia]|nr:hypothetical protein EJ07DRAFT_151599 [Lizonia empirigonia]
MSASNGNLVVPPGWRAEWSAQYSRYFYINLSTNESSWVLPTAPPVQQVAQPIQRKPVPSHPQALASNPVPYGSHSSPPPQTPGGYFPASPAQFQLGHGQTQMVQPQQQQQAPYQQPFTPFPAQQQPQFTALPTGTQQFSPPPTPGSFQEQQRNVASPSAIPSSGYASPVPLNPQYAQQQTFGQPGNPGFNDPQQRSIVTPPLDYQKSHYGAAPSNLDAYQAPPPPQSQAPYYPQYAQGGGAQPQHVQQQQQQQQNYYPQSQPQQHQQAQPSARMSGLGSDLMGGSMMTKMSSKFTQFQKPAQTAPSSASRGAPAAQNNAKPSADWKKWGKRAAIGVAAVGALALGVDAMDGGIFDGAAAAGGGDFGGGGDLSGGGDLGAGDWSGGDTQTSIDANAAQLAMEQQGQQNALMLLDPPGTTYIQSDGGLI